MNLSEIRRSSWARRFRKEAPSSYARALEYAAEPDLQVSIELRTDLGGHKPLWAVVVAEPRSGDADFWMDGCKTRSAAESLCERMGWKFD